MVHMGIRKIDVKSGAGGGWQSNPILMFLSVINARNESSSLIAK